MGSISRKNAYWNIILLQKIWQWGRTRLKTSYYCTGYDVVVGSDRARRIIFIFLMAFVRMFYPYNRGALFTDLLVIYALTSGIAGYASTSFYCQLEGTNWLIKHKPLVRKKHKR